MLRVGLTGGLGSGKSTAARMFAALGAHVLQSDTIGREMMEPGQEVYTAIAAHFGPGVVMADGRLDRAELARIAFVDGRVEELNAIVHPAVIARQMEMAEEIFAREPKAVVMVESALIFETNYGYVGLHDIDGSEERSGERWQRRFDKIILVTAPEEMKIDRYVARAAGGETLTEERRMDLEDEAVSRLERQMPDELKSSMSDYVLTNEGSLQELEWQVDRLWPILQAVAAQG